MTSYKTQNCKNCKPREGLDRDQYGQVIKRNGQWTHAEIWWGKSTRIPTEEFYSRHCDDAGCNCRTPEPEVKKPVKPMSNK